MSATQALQVVGRAAAGDEGGNNFAFQEPTTSPLLLSISPENPMAAAVPFAPAAGQGVPFA